ncbi:MAG: phosphate ABC transporter substrate-binding protein [Clostridiales bacterium GWF2_38_85]|nr:MAG: phosphate ABC transporter substrate-binding protein [Clostridiales bacterium GWF2_38_85]HBL83921.1 phosphate ABC transporter substrate-binding protein [Clostridiales bacterium]
MKKLITLFLSMIMAATMLFGCSENYGKNESAASGVSEASTTSTTSTASDFKNDTEIAVISREEGSGTRGAFIELFGIEKKDDNGEKVDYTTVEADITNNTNVMMTTVAGNKYAIGYISLGSLNNTVKAVKINGIAATVENIKNGTYEISRPFNIATKEGLSDAAQDFIDYILSSNGQTVIEAAGYISASDSAAYAGSKPSGTIKIAGSSSVTPVMEKLKEAYLKINTNATIEIQQSDSTTGMNSAKDGICDIGMASRELKDSEIAAGLTPQVIAMDGIAVIVNNDNPVNDLTKEQVEKIFTGETTEWFDVITE